MKPKPLPGILAAILLAACTANPPAAQPPTPTPIPTSVIPASPQYTVQRGDIVRTLDFDGRIVPVVQQEAFFRADGVVREFFVRRGDNVKAGDPLAVLEGLDDLERRQALQQIQVDRAAVRLENAELNLQIFTETTEVDTPEEELERQIRSNEVALAQLDLDEARLFLEDIQSLIDASLLTAPMDGQVLALHAEPGAHAAAYQPVLTIGDLSQLEVSAEVSTSALEELTAGMPVTIQAVTGGGEIASGTIRLLPGIAPSSEDEDRAVRIEIDPALAGNFALGDLVKVFVEIDRRTNVLWLPPQAIRSFSGRRFVVVQDGANQRSIDVELGLRGQNRIEIIPVEGQETVEEGQIVLGP